MDALSKASEPDEIEIEITPAMVEAGGAVFRAWLEDAENYRAIEADAYGDVKLLVGEIATALHRAVHNQPVKGA